MAGVSLTLGAYPEATLTLRSEWVHWVANIPSRILGRMKLYLFYPTRLHICLRNGS